MKSYIAIKILEKIGKRAIILVDEISLANQWISYFLETTNLTEAELVIVQGTMRKAELEKIDTAKIIVASKDSLFGKNNLIAKMKKDIGTVIIDEAHTASI